MAKTCTYGECPKPVKARELCAAHYRRFMLYGHPGEGQEKAGRPAKPWWEK